MTNAMNRVVLCLKKDNLLTSFFVSNMIILVSLKNIEAMMTIKQFELAKISELSYKKPDSPIKVTMFLKDIILFLRQGKKIIMKDTSVYQKWRQYCHCPLWDKPPYNQ